MSVSSVLARHQDINESENTKIKGIINTITRREKKCVSVIGGKKERKRERDRETKGNE